MGTDLKSQKNKSVPVLLQIVKEQYVLSTKLEAPNPKQYQSTNF
jgi:hypothetical protein